jgi:hypothetical protein
MRAAIVIIAFLPFLYYAVKDARFHFVGRRVSLAEHLLHLAIGISLAIVLAHAVMGNSGLMLIGLLLLVFSGGVDEYIWHRGIPEVESDLHAKQHLALLIFVVATLVVNWLEVHEWQVAPLLSDVLPGATQTADLTADEVHNGEPVSGNWQRGLLLSVFLVPYAYFGLNDNLHHIRHRHVCWAERILHLAIVLSLFTVVPHAIMGNRPVLIAGLVLFLVARALDEWGFHRNLPGREADMHAKTHFAFLIFVVMLMTVDWIGHDSDS